jgi:nitrite reductase (NADH) large subunit
MSRRLVFRQERCLACRSCELACAVVHSRTGRLESALLEELTPRRRVAIVNAGGGPEALRCEQCDDPLCALSCKSGALSRDVATGALAFEEDRCLGCLMCLMVCPSGVRPDASGERVVRCDVCHDRELPACVEACPTRALGVGEAERRVATSAFSGHVVVLGSSVAGLGACEAAREHAPACTITLVTPDSPPTYSRPLLPYVLGSQIGPEALEWRSGADLRARLGVELRAARARRLDVVRRRVALDDGTELPYDRLVVATGARGVRLRVPGAGLPEVFTLREASDLSGISDRAHPGGRAVVVGGGNVGLQACEALRARGLDVSLVVASAHVLSRMVDAEAGRRVGELLAASGIALHTGRDVREISGDAHVQAVALDDGTPLPADLVVVGKGIEAEVEWLADSGLGIARGIVVDRSGRTSASDVFAAGDCAEAVDPLTGRTAIAGTWPVAHEMGRAAGSTAVGVERQTRGALRMNAARLFGTSVISIGEVDERRLPGAWAEVLARDADSYRKLVRRDGCIVGAVLFGDVSDAGLVYRLYRDQIVLGSTPWAEMSPAELRELARPETVLLEA